MLAAALAAYVWLVSVLGRPWSDTAFIAALALVPLFGVLGVWVTAKLAGAKARQLALVCPSCGAPIVDARGRVTVRDQQCDACGQVVFAPADAAVPTTRQLPTREEFNQRVTEWRALKGDHLDNVKLVGGPILVIVFLIVGFTDARKLPGWLLLVVSVLIAVPLVMFYIYRAREIRLVDRLQLACECGVLLAEPEGPDASRAVMAAVKDLERMRKNGRCWSCGRQVWQAETTS